MYINTFKYTPKDVSCQLCTEYVKKLGCTALRCPWLAERIEAGVVGYREAVLETFPHERRLFQRLNLLIKHYPGSLWSNEQHERRMQYQCAVQGYTKDYGDPQEIYEGSWSLTDSGEHIDLTMTRSGGRQYTKGEAPTTVSGMFPVQVPAAFDVFPVLNVTGGGGAYGFPIQQIPNELLMFEPAQG